MSDKINIRLLIAKKLMELRKNACLSQTEVAKRSGMMRPIVSRLESGKTESQMSTIYRYCNAIGCSIFEVTRVIDEANGWVFPAGSGKPFKKERLDLL